MKEDWGDALEPKFAGLVQGLEAESRKSQGRSWKEKGHSYRMTEAAWAGEEVIRKCPRVNSSELVRDTRCAHCFTLEASAQPQFPLPSNGQGDSILRLSFEG